MKKTTPRTKFWAVWQSCGPVYGIGRTASEAIDNARDEGASGPITDYVGQSRVQGALYVSRCSASLYKAVTDNGGRLACERGELASFASDYF